jgi:hypothetical protein
MNIRHFKVNSLIFLVSLFTFLLTQAAVDATPTNSELISENNTLENSKTVQKSASPDRNFNQSVERTVSELSEEQVRRMLIEELRKQTHQGIAATPQREKLGGIANLLMLKFSSHTLCT